MVGVVGNDIVSIDKGQSVFCIQDVSDGGFGDMFVENLQYWYYYLVIVIVIGCVGYLLYVFIFVESGLCFVEELYDDGGDGFFNVVWVDGCDIGFEFVY